MWQTSCCLYYICLSGLAVFFCTDSLWGEDTGVAAVNGVSIQKEPFSISEDNIACEDVSKKKISVKCFGENSRE